MSLAPGLFPRECCRTTESEGERRCYQALVDQLPRGWYAWHSLRIRTPVGWEGEGDFVIAAPEKGILVLEIKGGAIHVADGRWFQNGKPMDPAPREQGNRIVRHLVQRLKDKDCQPPAYGVITFFPDTSFSRPPTEDDVAECVLGSQDLAWLSEALKSAFESALPPARPGKGRWIEALHLLWGETWTPHLTFGQRANVEKVQRVKLDRDQLELLDGIESNPTVLVAGGAGTGKTLLAKEIASRFAASGKRTLLLCFTEPLAKWLNQDSAHPGFTVYPVKRFAAALLTQAGMSVDEKTDVELWKDISLRAAAEALPQAECAWDAIVIDEAQDFTADDWMLVEELARGKWLWAFWDCSQSFWPERQIKQDLFQTRWMLKKAYRCPAGIQALAQTFNGCTPQDERIRDAVAEGIITIIECPSVQSINAKIAVELDKLCSDGLQPQEIAVLSLRGGAPADSIVHNSSLGRHRLVRADDPEYAKHVVAETFLRFKGLERAAIIVADLHLAKECADLNKRLYIALTRSLVLVRIAAARVDLESNPLLKRIHELQVQLRCK